MKFIAQTLPCEREKCDILIQGGRATLSNAQESPISSPGTCMLVRQRCILNIDKGESGMPYLQTQLIHADLKLGHFMVSQATQNSANGNIHVTEDMTCTNKIAGFTGGIGLKYYNENMTLIGSSPSSQYGLGQAPLIGAAHRHEEFDLQPPPGTTAILLHQFWDPHNRFGPIADSLATFFQEMGQWLANAGEAAAQWCQANPGLCAGAVGVLLFAGLAAGGVFDPVIITIGGAIGFF